METMPEILLANSSRNLGIDSSGNRSRSGGASGEFLKMLMERLPREDRAQLTQEIQRARETRERRRSDDNEKSFRSRERKAEGERQRDGIKTDRRDRTHAKQSNKNEASSESDNQKISLDGMEGSEKQKNVLESILNQLDKLGLESFDKLVKGLKELDESELKELFSDLVKFLENPKKIDFNTESKPADELLDSLKKLSDKINKLIESLNQSETPGEKKLRELQETLTRLKELLTNMEGTESGKGKSGESSSEFKQLSQKLSQAIEQLGQFRDQVSDSEKNTDKNKVRNQSGQEKNQSKFSRLRSVLKSLREEIQQSDLRQKIRDRNELSDVKKWLTKLLEKGIQASSESSTESREGQAYRELLQQILRSGQGFSPEESSDGGNWGGVSDWSGIAETGESGGLGELSSQAREILFRSVQDGIQSGGQSANFGQNLQNQKPMDALIRQLLLGNKGATNSESFSGNRGEVLQQAVSGGRMSQSSGRESGRLQAQVAFQQNSAFSTPDGLNAGLAGGGSGGSSGGGGRGGFGSAGQAGGSANVGRQIQNQKIAQQIIQQTQTMIENGRQSMRMQLNPESLGQVKLEVAVESSRVSVKMGVENSTVQQAINDKVTMLQETLESMDMTLEDVDVHDMSSGESDEFSDWFSEGSSRNQTPGRGIDDGEPTEEEPGRQVARRPLREYSTIELVG